MSNTSYSLSSQAELEKRLQLGETPEERRLRERNRVEEADNELTDDLFGGAGNKGPDGGIANLSLKNMQVCRSHQHEMAVIVALCVVSATISLNP